MISMKKVYRTLMVTTMLLFAMSIIARSQGVVTGVVKEETGTVIPGANVLIKGTTNGVATDNSGKFSLTASASDVLVISFIGFNPQEILVGSKTSIEVSLTPDVMQLGEIVVVGYGTQQKKDITGSVSSISQKEFEAQPISRMDQALQGRVPGVQVTSNSGAPGGDVKIRIRGSNSISGGNDPLYVVDGYIGADFRNLNPDDIESIQVLKDASATAIYGSRGANGVVLVTTKNGGSTGLNISLTTRYTSMSVAKSYDLLNADNYAATVNERNAALGLAPTYSGTWLRTIKRPIINVGENLGLIKTRMMKSIRKKVITYLIGKKLFLKTISISAMNVAKKSIPAAALISLSFKTGIL